MIELECGSTVILLKINSSPNESKAADGCLIDL